MGLENIYVEGSLDNCRKDLWGLDSDGRGLSILLRNRRVFGIWFAIAGLILAIVFAVTTVAFVPPGGGAR